MRLLTESYFSSANIRKQDHLLGSITTASEIEGPLEAIGMDWTLGCIYPSFLKLNKIKNNNNQSTVLPGTENNGKNPKVEDFLEEGGRDLNEVIHRFLIRKTREVS